MKKLFCVWDGNYSDFLENFETPEKAINYCLDCIKKNSGVIHNYKIGKWVESNDPMSTDYNLLKRISYNGFTDKKVIITKA